MNAHKFPLGRSHTAPSAPTAPASGRGGTTSTTWPTRDICKNGHARTPGNVLRDRSCRICKVERNRAYRAARRTAGPAQRFPDSFWAKAAKSSECWDWSAYKSELGYGRVHFQGRLRRATHIAWFLTRGEFPPDGMVVCHTCDNPGCINPVHLWMGTQSDNMRDMVAKGRHLPAARAQA